MGDCYICGEETDKGKKNFGSGEWIYLCCRACDDEYDPYEAESFGAEDMITITGIDWETDGEDVDLPTTMEVPADLEEDEIADYLSDQKGWLVNGFVMGAETFEAEGEPTISYWQLSKSGPFNSSEANISVDFEGRKFGGKLSEFDDEGNQVFGVESFDAEVKDRHPTLSKKAKSEYVFPERKAYPIGDERHAMLALVYSTWPNNKKDASEVRRKVFQRYPQLRTEFMDGKYETRNAESFDAESCDYCEEPVAYVSDIKEHPKCEHGQHLYCNSCIGAENDFCLLCVEGEEFEAEGKKVKSVIETAMKEYDEYVADKEAYDDDDIISFEEWFDDILGNDDLEGDEETLEYLKTLPPYNSPESNDWIWKIYHGAENFDAGKGGYGAEEGGKCSCCGNKIVNGSCGCPSDCPHCGGRPLDSESFEADWDNAPYGSWDEAWSDEVSFPTGEKPERLWLKNLSVIAVFAGAIWIGKQTRK